MNPARKVKLLCGGLFVFFGFVVTVYAAFVFASPDVPEEFTASTEATIAKIESYRFVRNGEWETDHDVTVSYLAEGRPYEVLLDYYISSMREGDAVIVHYDTRDPAVLFTPGAKNLAMAVIGAVGLIFLTVGVVILRMRTHTVEPAAIDELEEARFDEELDLLERLANGEIEIVEKTPEDEKNVEGEPL